MQEMDNGESCTVRMYLVPLNCTVTYGENSMFYLCDFYHNKKYFLKKIKLKKKRYNRA